MENKKFDLMVIGCEALDIFENELKNAKVNVSEHIEFDYKTDVEGKILFPIDDVVSKINIAVEIRDNEKAYSYEDMRDRIITPAIKKLASKVASKMVGVSFIKHKINDECTFASYTNNASILVYETYDMKSARKLIIFEIIFVETGKDSGYRVFLGGTCNGSLWREALIKELKIGYFNPVVEDWTPECMDEEIRQRNECDFCLYTITPRMTGVYSIAEVVDDSNKRPEKTIFCVTQYDQDFDNPNDTITYDKHAMKSLQQTARMVSDNGCLVFQTLSDVAMYLNSYAAK